MKKNSLLYIIVSLSLVMFVVLIVSIININKNSNRDFYYSGFISDTTKESSSKIYFASGTEYKDAYNSKITFKDENNNKVNVSKYSFVYYDDNSISFLNEGVILNLDDISSSLKRYYNIKSDYIIKKENNSYYIETSTGKLSFKNFIARISDDKYLIAGNCYLKSSLNSEGISSDTFELNFLEGNAVKVDYKDTSIQTINDESYILIDKDIKIDLTSKNVYYKNDLVLSLEEIVINHDDNINIEYKKEDTGSGDGKGNGSGSGSSSKQYKIETVVDYKKVPFVQILSTSVNSRKITLSFDVIDTNNLIDGTIDVKLINMSNSSVFEQSFEKGLNEYNFIADNLQSNAPYILTIITSYVKDGSRYNNHIMFQRTFNTSSIGSEIKKDYVTSSEASFNINLEDTTFTSATLNLYDKNDELVYFYTFANNGSSVNVLFTGLDSNESYTAKLENIFIGNTLYTDGYAALEVIKTLKENPFTSEVVLMPIATTYKKDYYFKLDLGISRDLDSSIKNVVYNIYDKETDELVKTITSDSLASITLEVKDEIQANNTYYFNAKIVVNDNEKNIEYTSMNSNDFSMNNKVSPYAKFIKSYVTANTLGGTFIVYDEDNSLSLEHLPYVEYVSSLGDTLNKELEFIECSENESETTKCLNVSLDNLHSSDEYTLFLYGYVDTLSEDVTPDYEFIGAAKVPTEEASIINAQFNQTELDTMDTLEKLFDVDLNLSITEGVTDQVIVDNLEKFDLLLYEGKDATGIYLGTLNARENLIENYFDNSKKLTIEDFGTSLDNIRKIHLQQGTIMSTKFTIMLTNGKSGSDYVDFLPSSFTFDVNDVVLGLSENYAEISLSTIINSNTEENIHYDNTLKESTAIGIKADIDFGNKEYANKLFFKIYDATEEKDPLELSFDYTYSEEALPSFEFYTSDYPEFLIRGHEYYIEFYVSLDINGDDETDFYYPFDTEDVSIVKPAKSDNIGLPKEDISVRIFPWTSSEDSITYKYAFEDKDSAIPEEYDIYYTIEDNEFIASKIDCVNSEDVKNYNTEYKCFKLDNLSKNDEYSILVKPEFVIETPSDREIYASTFEGINTLDAEYEVLLNEGVNKYNNLLTLKLTGESLSLIANYTLTLENDNKKFVIDNINDNSNGYNIINYYENNTLIKTWNLYANGGENIDLLAFIENDEDNTYLYFDYSKLYNSNLFGENINSFKDLLSTISLSCSYDSGKVGYLASSKNKYVIKMSDGKYVVLTSKTSLINKTYALGGVYAYSADYRFVDDNSEDNNTTSGMMYLINTSYSNFIPLRKDNYIETGYSVTKDGVQITFGGQSRVIVVNELANGNISGSGTFTFDKVVPSVKIIGDAYVNGISLGLSISGIKTSVIEEESGNRYLYIETYNKNNALVKTSKVNINNLISVTGTINGNEFIMPSTDGYDYDIDKVYINNTLISSYYYDYSNKKIVFDNSYNGQNIHITYKIAINELKNNTEYYIKCYINPNNKIYLADSTDVRYNDLVYRFNTLKLSSLNIKNLSFIIDNKGNYSDRELSINYEIAKLLGIKEITYEICSDSSCLDEEKTIYNLGSYTNYENTSVSLDKSYKLKHIYDSSITEDYDVLYNANYVVKINAKFTEENTNNTYTIYSGNLNLRGLYNPYTTIISRSGIDNNPYLEFDVSITDVDRVVSSYDDGYLAGEYYAYLAIGSSRIKVAGTDKKLSITENGADKVSTIRYDNLSVDQDYYLIVEYRTYQNNKNQEDKTKVYSVPYLSYTLASNGISVGKKEYVAMSNKTILKFGYAANIVRDYVSPGVPDENQEAFVAGIVYTITRTSGDNTFRLDGDFLFDESNPIVNKTDGSSDGVGENYYQMTLPGTVYPAVAGYDITYRFYLGGKISSSLNTESKCLDNSPANKWNSTLNECYILSNVYYTDYTTYEGGK